MDYIDEHGFGISYRDLENYSTIAGITDFSDYEKGNIKTEVGKFIFNGKTAYREIFVDILKGSSRNLEDSGQYFNQTILENSEINTTPMNPRVLALCFLFGTQVGMNGRHFFIRERMKQLLDMVYQIEIGRDFHNTMNIDVPVFKQFIKKNGINSSNLIRYVHFYEKKMT